MIAVIGKIDNVTTTASGYKATVNRPDGSYVDVLWHNPSSSDAPVAGMEAIFACNVNASGSLVGVMLADAGIRYSGDNPGDPPPTSPFGISCGC